MKERFDNKNIHFFVSINGEKINGEEGISFIHFRGVDPNCYCEKAGGSFKLIGKLNLQFKEGIISEVMKKTFEISDFSSCITFEDAVKKHFDENHEKFDPLEMNLALCFLSRFCMKDKKVKKLKKKYESVLKDRKNNK